VTYRHGLGTAPPPEAFTAVARRIKMLAGTVRGKTTSSP